MKVHSRIFVVVLLLICTLITACSNSTSQAAALSGVVPPQESQESTPLQASSDAATSQAPAEQTKEADSGVDVDLTKLNSIMAYSEVFSMMTAPEKYMGKTIKMQGAYYATYSEDTKKYYHTVIIEDANACCQQGLEFIWNGEHTYPEDYPIDGTNVVVTGVFSTYEELGLTYLYLAMDELVVIE